MAKKYMLGLLATFMVVGGLTLFAAPAAFAGNCDTCRVIPATPTTTTTTTTTSSSHTRIVIKKTVKATVRQYEKAHNVIVAIHVRPGGVASAAGCIDPVRKGWIEVGGYFVNTDRFKRKFPDRWKTGRSVCNAHRVKMHGKYWMKGTKDNCFNVVWIPLQKVKVPHIKRVVEFRTVKRFLTVYDRWVSKKSASTTNTTVNTTWSCPVGWTPINGGSQCQKCEHVECVPPPPSPPSCTVNCSPPPPTCPPGQTGTPPNCKTPPPVQHSCSLTIGNAPKDNPALASASVNAGGEAANVVVNWGDGQVSGPGTHTYPTPAPGPAGAGVTYTITATATFGDGQTVSCGSGTFFVPAPPPSGNIDPPPLP